MSVIERFHCNGYILLQVSLFLSGVVANAVFIIVYLDVSTPRVIFGKNPGV